MFSYRFILKQAWQISKKFKYLWFFGLFASITAIGGSWEYSLISQGMGGNLIDNSYLNLEKLINIFDILGGIGLGMVSLFTNGFVGAMNALAILITTFVFFAAAIWIAICSQGALVNSLKNILEGKKKNTEIKIRENLTVGHRNFWPLFGLNITIQLFILFSFLIVSLPLLILALNDFSGLNILYVILFIIFIPLATGAALAIKYAVAYQVFEEKGFMKSLLKGWGLFKKNWLISLEMAVILFIVSFLAGLLFLAIVFFPLSLIFIGSLALQQIWLSYILMFLALAAVILFGSVLTTFQVSAWTGLFVELKEKNILAKLERLFRK